MPGGVRGGDRKETAYSIAIGNRNEQNILHMQHDMCRVLTEGDEPKVLELFCEEKSGYRFRKEDNQPKLLETERFFMQKLEYIHMNPVRKGYVERPEHWKWSSANPGSEIDVASIW